MSTTELIQIIVAIPLILVCIAVVIVLAFTGLRVPSKELPTKEKSDLIQYGLLHFTTQEKEPLIRNSDCIRFAKGRSLYLGGKYLTWYFPCTQSVTTEYISKIHKDMVKMQPKKNICIHITGITEDMSYDFRYKHRTGHMMHVGSLKADMTFYQKTKDGWIRKS